MRVDRGRRRGQTFQRVNRVEGDQKLSLGRVLFPLRYDLFAMRGFIQYYEDHRAEWSVDALIENAPRYMQDRIYFVHGLRVKWGLLDKLYPAKYERRCKKYIRGNMRVLIGLWNIIQREGYLGSGKGFFTFKHPVESDAKTREGHNMPSEFLHLTNGQHRMVILLAMGYIEIPPEWYAIAHVRDFEAVETTHEYIKRGKLPESEFCEFARLRFPDMPKDTHTIATLSEWAHDTEQPGWLHYYLKEYWGDAA